MESAVHTGPESAPDSTREPDTNRWRLPDLLDFDYYVDRDEQRIHADPAERKRLMDRDRHFYRERIAPHVKAPEHTPAHRSASLRRWLGIRRGAEDPAIRALLPGSVFARGQRLVAVFLGVIGFFAGIGVASALLQYEGDRPVNVSWFVFVLVILQMLLLVSTAAAWYNRRSRAMRAAVHDLSLVGHLLKPVFATAARWVQHQRMAHLPPDVRERAKAREGLLSAHFSLYGPAAYLPMLIPAQLFGIGFNLGAILTTIALQWFTDLAFGWGSALDVQPGTIHALVQLIALPWSWLFGEGVGLPTLEQVQGTRISLKDPLFIMDAEQLRSWRSFLVLSLLTYGLMPRLILLGLSVIKERRTLASLPFTHQRTQALYARMITPQLETGGGSGHGPEMHIPGPLTRPSAPRVAPRSGSPRAPAKAPTAAAAVTSPPRAARTAGAQPMTQQATATPPAASANAIAPDACLLLMHVDVADMLEPSDHERLQGLLRSHSGWRVASVATFGGGSAMAKQALDMIDAADWQAPPARVAILTDGSQPPITETLRFLRSVRAAAGEHAQVLVLLVGDPEGDDPLPPLSAFELQDWQHKMERLGDPYLRLEMLAGPAEEGD